MFDNHGRGFIRRAIAALLFIPACFIGLALLRWLVELLICWLTPLLPGFIVAVIVLGGGYLWYRRR
ncbi:hypothetical protein [Flindersiella endophytica]